MRMRERIACLAALASVLALATPACGDPAFDALVATYPDHIATYDDKDVIWRDGSRSPISNGRNGKTFDRMLVDPDIKDQFAIPYPLPAQNPGRERRPRAYPQRSLVRGKLTAIAARAR